MIQESQLSHALKDMQQFLQFYQDKEEVFEIILAKIDIIVDQLEKKIYKDVFGEHCLQKETMTNHS